MKKSQISKVFLLLLLTHLFLFLRLEAQDNSKISNENLNNLLAAKEFSLSGFTIKISEVEFKNKDQLINMLNSHLKNSKEKYDKKANSQNSKKVPHSNNKKPKKDNENRFKNSNSKIVKTYQTPKNGSGRDVVPKPSEITFNDFNHTVILSGTGFCRFRDYKVPIRFEKLKVDIKINSVDLVKYFNNQSSVKIKPEKLIEVSFNVNNAKVSFNPKKKVQNTKTEGYLVEPKVDYYVGNGFIIYLNLSNLDIDEKKATSYPVTIVVDNDTLPMVLSSKQEVQLYNDGRLKGGEYDLSYRDHLADYKLQIEDASVNLESREKRKQGIYLSGKAIRKDNSLKENEGVTFKLEGKYRGNDDFVFILTQNKPKKINPLPDYKINLKKGCVIIRYGNSSVEQNIQSLDKILEYDEKLTTWLSYKQDNYYSVTDFYFEALESENSSYRPKNMVVDKYSGKKSISVYGQFLVDIDQIPTYYSNRDLTTNKEIKIKKKDYCMLTNHTGWLFSNLKIIPMQLRNSHIFINPKDEIARLKFRDWGLVNPQAQNQIIKEDRLQGLVIENGDFIIEMTQIEPRFELGKKELEIKHFYKTPFWGELALTKEGINGKLLGGGYQLVHVNEEYTNKTTDFQRFSLQEIIALSDTKKLNALLDNLYYQRDSTDNYLFDQLNLNLKGLDKQRIFDTISSYKKTNYNLISSLNKYITDPEIRTQVSKMSKAKVLNINTAVPKLNRLNQEMDSLNHLYSVRDKMLLEGAFFELSKSANLNGFDTSFYYKTLYRGYDLAGYLTKYWNLTKNIEYYEARKRDLLTPPYYFIPPEPESKYILSDEFLISEMRIDFIVFEKGRIQSSQLEMKINLPEPTYETFTLLFNDLDMKGNLKHGVTPFADPYSRNELNFFKSKTSYNKKKDISANKRKFVHYYWKLPIVINTLDLNLFQEDRSMAGQSELKSKSNLQLTGWLQTTGLFNQISEGLYFEGSISGSGKMTINTNQFTGKECCFGKDLVCDHPVEVIGFQFNDSGFGTREYDYKYQLKFPLFPYFGEKKMNFTVYNDSLVMQPIPENGKRISYMSIMSIPYPNLDGTPNLFRKFIIEPYKEHNVKVSEYANWQLVSKNDIQYDFGNDVFSSSVSDDPYDLYISEFEEIKDSLKNYRLNIASVYDAKFIAKDPAPVSALNNENSLSYTPYVIPPRSLFCYDNEVRDFLFEEMGEDFFPDTMAYNNYCIDENYYTGDLIVFEAGKEEKIKLSIPNTAIEKNKIINNTLLEVNNGSLRIENSILSLEGETDAAKGLNFKIPGICKLDFEGDYMIGDFEIDLNYCPGIPVKGARFYFLINMKEGYFAIMGNAAVSYYLDLEGTIFITNCPENVLMDADAIKKLTDKIEVQNRKKDDSPFGILAGESGFKTKDEFVNLCYSDLDNGQSGSINPNVAGSLAGLQVKLDENFEKVGLVTVRIGGGVFYWHYPNTHVLGAFLNATAGFNDCVVMAEIHAALSARYFPTSFDVVASGMLDAKFCVGGAVGHCSAGVNADATYGLKDGLNYKLKFDWGCGWGCCN